MARRRYRTPSVITPLGRYVCGRCGQRFAWRSEHPKYGGRQPRYCSAECAERPRTYRGECICGQPIMSAKSKDVFWCSPACSKKVHAEPLPADHWARWVGRTSLWKAPARSLPPRMLDLVCDLCREPFRVPYWKSQRKTCDGCRQSRDSMFRQAAKHRRRARKKDAYVADVYRLDVYARDGWRCHLCGKKVRRDKSAPHPLAPTVDHVVPLAAGGTHEPANCATAHFICNARKGHRGGGEQLALIG